MVEKCGGDGVKEGKNNFPNGGVVRVVIGHEVGEKGRVTVGVSVIGGIIDGGIGVDFVVNVGDS